MADYILGTCVDAIAAALPIIPTQLGLNPAFTHALPMVKYLRERDLIEFEPLFAQSDEAEFLIKRFEEYSHTSAGWGGRDFSSLRGEPRDDKVMALRLIRFKWVFGVSWERVGAPTPLGLAILKQYLENGEAARNSRFTALRKKWFPTSAEHEIKLAERARQDEADRIAECKRQESYDRHMDHRQRLLKATHEWEEHCLRLGRGQINDIDQAMDTLRKLTRCLDLEKNWTDEG